MEKCRREIFTKGAIRVTKISKQRKIKTERENDSSGEGGCLRTVPFLFYISLIFLSGLAYVSLLIGLARW